MKDLARILVESGLSPKLASACAGRQSQGKVAPRPQLEQEGAELPEMDHTVILQTMFALMGKKNPAIFDDAELAYDEALNLIKSLFKNKSLIKRIARKTASRGAGASQRMAKKSITAR